MFKYIKNHWGILSLSSLVWVITLYIVLHKPINQNTAPEHIIRPKTDSVIAAADSLVLIFENRKNKLNKVVKEKEKIEKQLKIEKKRKKPSKEKTKIVFQTKEVVVEKQVIIADPNNKKFVEENYKIQEENNNLRGEIDLLKKSQRMVSRDSITTDTIRRKRRRFLIF